LNIVKTINRTKEDRLPKTFKMKYLSQNDAGRVARASAEQEVIIKSIIDEKED
jgi:hypothetical protein